MRVSGRSRLHCWSPGCLLRERDTDDTKSPARDIARIPCAASLSVLGSIALQTRRLDMRQALIAFTAIASLALAGVLVAAPSANKSTQAAKAEAGIDIFSLSQRARDLPEQSYPAH